MHGDWESKAVLFELLARVFAYADLDSTAQVLADGEFADALAESVERNGLGDELALSVRDLLCAYRASDVREGRSRDASVFERELFHRLRVEHTRLFVGSPHAVVSPYAGVWYAQEQGIDPLTFVNRESMAVERAMLAGGLVRPAGTNEPLDHLATEFEFLNYLCLGCAGAFGDESHPAWFDTYRAFYADHVVSWCKRFAHAVLDATQEPLFVAGACIVRGLPEGPL